MFLLKYYILLISSCPLTTPFSTLNNSKKLESSVDDKVFLVNVNSILNL